MQHTYTIKEFEKVTGVGAHTLRYFDKVGLLSPARGKNGYRLYSLEQVSIAEVITLLQQTMFTNSEIKVMLDNYNSEDTISCLKANQIVLHQEILKLRNAHKVLGQHIDYLEHLKVVRKTLNKPFIECLPQREVGLIQPKVIRDIVDCFDAGDDIIGNPTWPHFSSHGLLVAIDQVSENTYPIQAMYVEHKQAIKANRFDVPAGDYLSMYCGQSMENNPHVAELIKHAQEIDFDCDAQILIEQVSGPVVEKNKDDFLVKVMLRRKD